MYICAHRFVCCFLSIISPAYHLLSGSRAARLLLNWLIDRLIELAGGGGISWRPAARLQLVVCCIALATNIIFVVVRNICILCSVAWLNFTLAYHTGRSFIFDPCDLLLHFPLLHFHQGCHLLPHFPPCIYYRIAFSTSAFSVAPNKIVVCKILCKSSIVVAIFLQNYFGAPGSWLLWIIHSFCFC